MYGHIQQLAEAEKEGIEAAGGKADIFRYALSITGRKWSSELIVVHKESQRLFQKMCSGTRCMLHQRPNTTT